MRRWERRITQILLPLLWAGAGAIPLCGADDSAVDYQDGQRRYNRQIELHDPADITVRPDAPARKVEQTKGPESFFKPAPAPVENMPTEAFYPVAPVSPSKSRPKNWILPPAEGKSEKPGPVSIDMGWLAGEVQKMDQEADKQGAATDAGSPEESERLRAGLSLRDDRDEWEPASLRRPDPRRDPRSESAGSMRTSGPVGDDGNNASAINSEAGPAFAGAEPAAVWTLERKDLWKTDTLWDPNRREEPALPQTEALLGQLNTALRVQPVSIPSLNDLMPSPLMDAGGGFAAPASPAAPAGWPSPGGIRTPSSLGTAPAGESRLHRMSPAPESGSEPRALEPLRPTGVLMPFEE
jgi:hypothetical protein